MAELICKYNPIPPRAWSRVQSPCSLGFSDSQISQMQAKGNVLQYRSNQLPLTSKQRYARVVHQWTPSRTKSFATQTTTYSNPNTRQLQRVGSTTFSFPNNIVGAPNNPAGPFISPVVNPNGCPTDAVETFGSLICGTRVDSCGVLLKPPNPNSVLCAESAASDVPGNVILCWDRRLQTWIPRVRRVMPTSADKFPVNYKFLRSAVQFT